MPSRFHFSPERHEPELLALIEELDRTPRVDGVAWDRIVRRHPKTGSGFFSKSELIRGFRHLNRTRRWGRDERPFVDKVRMKPVRTLSGVAPVTVLTKPFPCPGKCIFCPSDVRMPKSYLSDEPGAQRAAQHRFDPYAQTLSRLQTYHNIGHRADKAELIVLGGTWSFYPEPYQIWFVKRCLDALNDFRTEPAPVRPRPAPGDGIDYAANTARIDGAAPAHSYSRVVAEFATRAGDAAAGAESATWVELERAQRVNETAACRSVGLVVETRPDAISLEEVVRIRRLGATKVQIGLQSLSDAVLRANRRGHDVAASRRAIRLLRQAGFKIHAHWMPNLYGSSPAADRADFERLFADPDFRPDELKIYPCSLIASAELMSVYRTGGWRPYGRRELLEVLVGCLAATPEYCRLTRIVRDIPGTDIVAGNRTTNFRQLVEAEAERRGLAVREIRAREVRRRRVREQDLALRETAYRTSVGEERFLQMVTPEDRVAGFLRLSLPRTTTRIDELAGCAVIREVHVYGRLVGLGERGFGRAQHAGLGRRLVARAVEIAGGEGFGRVAVISSIGTRRYYRRLGFEDGELYQHRRVDLPRR